MVPAARAMIAVDRASQVTHTPQGVLTLSIPQCRPPRPNRLVHVPFGRGGFRLWSFSRHPSNVSCSPRTSVGSEMQKKPDLTVFVNAALMGGALCRRHRGDLNGP